MRRTLLLIALLASVGINIGLLTHLGTQWRSARTAQDEPLDARSPFPVAEFLNGRCNGAGFTLNEDRLEEHLAQFEPELVLRPEQGVLVGELILQRATVGCRVRNQRADLRDRLEDRPLRSPETAKPFLTELLAIRANVTRETLRETELQSDLVESFTEEQLRQFTPQTLPRLVPGLSLRQLTGGQSRSSRRSQDRR